MLAVYSRLIAILLAVSMLAACSGSDDEVTLVGPGYEPGPGRIYPVRSVTFQTLDGVPVSASWGTATDAGEVAVVILLHDLDAERQAWLTQTPLYVELLERGYGVLSLDLRGYGETPLPDGREVPLLGDLELSFRDVLAALDWLATRPDVDVSRVALVGSGSGGNVAYVSMGALGERISTAVAMSPGLWERSSLQPVVVGAGLDPFAPRSLLYIVGGDDVLPTGGPDNDVLSYADFARALATNTADPSSVMVIPGSAGHGLGLLNSEPAVLDAVMLWLEQNL
jgi:uncharacterized protein